MKFVKTFSQNRDLVTFEFEGAIDESSRFPDVESLIENSSIVINLEKVDYINSLGIRNWVRWVTAITGNSLIFENIPVLFVRQMNIVKGIKPEFTTIKSFYVPYYCDACGSSAPYLYQSGSEFVQSTSIEKKTIKSPEPPLCQKCGDETEIDVIQEAYFSFLD